MGNNINPWELTIRETINNIYRHKKLIILTFALVLTFTLLGLQFDTPIYDADVKMLIKGQSLTSAGTYTSLSEFRIHLTQAEIVKSTAVLRRSVIALELPKRPRDYEKLYCPKLKKYFIDYFVKKEEEKLSVLSPEKREEQILKIAIEDLKSRISVRLVPNTDIFIINVQGFTPEEAIETANIVSRSYTIFDQQQQLAELELRYGELHPTVIQLKDNIYNLTNNLSGETLPDMQAIGTASVKVIDQAISNEIPVGKSKKLILIIAFFVAIFISLAMTLTLGIMDHTIKSPQDIVIHMNLPVLGSIPRKKRKEKFIIEEFKSKTIYKDFYEDLADQLYIFSSTQCFKSIVIASPGYNKNHEYIVPNIGFFLSEIMGHKTLLIDLNLNNPKFKKIYKIEEKKGLTDFSENLQISDIIQKITNGPDIITTEEILDKPSALLEKMQLKKIIKKAHEQYEIIIIDATSISNMNDLSHISACADSTALVFEEGLERRQILKTAIKPLEHNKIQILGGILNNRTFPIPGFIYNRF